MFQFCNTREAQQLYRASRKNGSTKDQALDIVRLVYGNDAVKRHA